MQSTSTRNKTRGVLMQVKHPPAAWAHCCWKGFTKLIAWHKNLAELRSMHEFHCEVPDSSHSSLVSWGKRIQLVPSLCTLPPNKCEATSKSQNTAQLVTSTLTQVLRAVGNSLRARVLPLSAPLSSQPTPVLTLVSLIVHSAGKSGTALRVCCCPGPHEYV